MKEEYIAPLLMEEFKGKLVSITMIVPSFNVTRKIIDSDNSGILVEDVKGKRGYIPIYNILEVVCANEE